MIHNLKFPDGTIKAVDCKLGSGITDKNGREIFEGDKVRFGKKTYKILCNWGGGFSLCDYKNTCLDLQDHIHTRRNKCSSPDIEIVND